MNTETKKINKWFWVWDDEKEEAWLRKMANQGWHLSKVGLINSYEFEQEEKRDVIYRIDYKNGYGLKLDEYLQFFSDSGWEHVFEMSGRHYFRAPMRGEDEPEIYTDNESKITKYQQILTGFYIFIPLFIMFIILRPEITKSPQFTIYDIFLIIILILEVIYIFSVINLIKRIRHLQRM